MTTTVSVMTTRAGARSRRVHKPGRLVTWLSVGWFVLLVVFAFGAPVLGLGNSSTAVGAPRMAPFEGGTWETILGTDNFGRSVLSRLAFGAQISLMVGVGSALIGAVIGTALGILAARFRRILEPIIDTLADAVLAVPPLVLMLTLVAVLQPSVPALVIGLTVSVIPTFARMVKANALGAAKRYYVTAAEALGASHFSVMMREILPNILSSILALSVVMTANLIVAEGSLSFLGLGVPPPAPSWGGMIADGRSQLADAPHIALSASVAIFLTVLALKNIGNALERRIDTRERKL